MFVFSFLIYILLVCVRAQIPEIKKKINKKLIALPIFLQRAQIILANKNPTTLKKFFKPWVLPFFKLELQCKHMWREKKEK